MKDKEQQLEEMAKDIVRSAGLGVYEKVNYLTDLGYRKIPEDAVVLSREEYINKLTKYYGVSEIKDMVRKETAREIATHIKGLLDDCEDVDIKMHYAGLLVWLQIAFGLEFENF